MKLDFQLKPKTGIGLVVDATGCQMAIVSAANGATRLLSRPTPAAADATAAPNPPSASDWLGQFRSDIGKGRFRLATAVNSREVCCRRVSLPSSDPAEVGQMLSLQIEKWSPLPLEEVVWSYEMLGSEGGSSDVLVVFGRKDKLVSRASEFGDEFLPDLIDVDLMVLWRALRARKMFEGREHSVLLWIDRSAKTAKCMLLKGSAPLLVEHFPIEESDPAAVRHSLSMLWVGAQANYGIETIEEMVLFAPDDGSLQLGTDAVSDLGVALTALRPTEELAAATGLAQRALRNGHAQVNLLPVDFVQRQQKKLFRQQSKRVGAMVLAVYAVVLVLFLGAWMWRNYSIRHINTQLTQIEPRYSQARLLQAEVNFLKQKLDDRRSALEILRVVTESKSDQVYLMNFVYKQGQSLDLRGVAANASDVYKFTDKLQKSGMFTQVNSGAIKNNPARGSEVTFDVSCVFVGKPAVTAPAAPGRRGS